VRVSAERDLESKVHAPRDTDRDRHMARLRSLVNADPDRLLSLFIYSLTAITQVTTSTVLYYVRRGVHNDYRPVNDTPYTVFAGVQCS